MAHVRSERQSTPYWRMVLDYCINGGIQAMLDEYAHVLYESLGSPEASRLMPVSQSRTRFQPHSRCGRPRSVWTSYALMPKAGLYPPFDTR